MTAEICNIKSSIIRLRERRMKITAQEIEDTLVEHAIHIIKEEKAEYELYKMKIQHLIDNAKYAEKKFSDEATRVLYRLIDKQFYESNKDQ